jgi:hypothetical protein
MVVPGLTELEAAKQLLLAALVRGVAADDVLPALQELEAFRNSLCQADHLLIQAADQHGLAERYCVSSVEKLVAQALRISYGDAKRRVRAAVTLGPRRSADGSLLPPLRAALASAQAIGELSPTAVDLIERALTTVDVIAPSRLVETELALVGYGRVFEPGELGRVCDRVLDHLDPDGSRPRDAIQRDRRELRLGRCRDGMIRVEGRLTAAAGARVQAVLGPLAAPRATVEPGPRDGERPVPDERSTGQRMHDALDEACARLLRMGNAPASGGTPATVIITMTEEQLAQTIGGGSSGASGVSGGGLVDTSTGEVLSIPEALRLATEAEIAPVVMSAAGRPLHLGRTRRLATPSQTLALIARDGGCSFPGCTIPPEWCERHHIVPWHLGGQTDVDNLTLLCGYHHGHFVRAGWTCQLSPDGLPAWRPPRWQERGREPIINRRIRRRIEPGRDLVGTGAPAGSAAGPAEARYPLRT